MKTRGFPISEGVLTILVEPTSWLTNLCSVLSWSVKSAYSRRKYELFDLRESQKQTYFPQKLNTTVFHNNCFFSKKEKIKINYEGSLYLY